jgi:hypothetical protein
MVNTCTTNLKATRQLIMPVPLSPLNKVHVILETFILFIHDIEEVVPGIQQMV